MKYALISGIAIILTAFIINIQLIQAINKQLSYLGSSDSPNIDSSVSGDKVTDTSLNEELGAYEEVIADTDSDAEENVDNSEGVNTQEDNILISTKKRTSQVKFSSFDRDEAFEYFHNPFYEKPEDELVDGVTTRAPDISLDEALSILSKASDAGKIIDRQSIEEVFNAMLYWLKYEKTSCRVSLNDTEITFDSKIIEKFTKFMHVGRLDAIANETYTGYDRIDVYLYEVELDNDNKPLSEYDDIVNNTKVPTPLSSAPVSTESDENKSNDTENAS